MQRGLLQVQSPEFWQGVDEGESAAGLSSASYCSIREFAFNCEFVTLLQCMQRVRCSQLLCTGNLWACCARHKPSSAAAIGRAGSWHSRPGTGVQVAVRGARWQCAEAVTR